MSMDADNVFMSWRPESDYNRLDTRNREGCFKTIVTIILFTFFIVLFFCSCRSVKYVPVETVTTQIVNTTDTVIEKDTITNEKEVIVREAYSSDSVLLAKLGLQLSENSRYILVLQRELSKISHERTEQKTDSAEKIKEVQVPYKVEVEKKLTLWQKIKVRFGGIALIIVLVVAGGLVLKVYVQRRLF